VLEQTVSDCAEVVFAGDWSGWSERRRATAGLLEPTWNLRGRAASDRRPARRTVGRAISVVSGAPSPWRWRCAQVEPWLIGWMGTGGSCPWRRWPTIGRRLTSQRSRRAGADVAAAALGLSAELRRHLDRSRPFGEDGAQALSRSGRVDLQDRAPPPRRWAWTRSCFKRLAARSIPVSRSRVLPGQHLADRTRPPVVWRHSAGRLPDPRLIVKPARLGSSIGMTVVGSSGDRAAAARGGRF
jgi:hypothetical protein